VHDIDHFILITSEALKMFLKAIASCSFQCKIEYKKYHFSHFVNGSAESINYSQRRAAQGFPIFSVDSSCAEIITPSHFPLEN
jgi:hypothetical protein